MARFRVNCGGCGFNEVFDDEQPQDDEAAEEWDAERTAEKKRDDHQLSEGHSVEIDRLGDN